MRSPGLRVQFAVQGYLKNEADVVQEVRAVVWQSEGLPVRSHPGRVEVSLSKTPNPQIAPDVLVGTLHGNQSVLVCEWVNKKHQLYSTLDKGAI